jgi:hypothetical protein
MGTVVRPEILAILNGTSSGALSRDPHLEKYCSWQVRQTKKLEQVCAKANSVKLRDGLHWVGCHSVGLTLKPSRLAEGCGGALPYIVLEYARGAELSRVTDPLVAAYWPRLEEALRLIESVESIFTGMFDYTKAPHGLMYFHMNLDYHHIMYDGRQLVVVDYDDVDMCCHHSYLSSTGCAGIPDCMIEDLAASKDAWTTIFFLIRLPFEILMRRDVSLDLHGRVYEYGESFEKIWYETPRAKLVRPEYAADWTPACDRLVVGFFSLIDLLNKHGRYELNGPPDVGKWALTGLPNRYSNLLRSALESLKPLTGLPRHGGSSLSSPKIQEFPRDLRNPRGFRRLDPLSGKTF